MAFGLTLGCNASPYSVEKNRSCCTRPCCENKTYKKTSFFGLDDVGYSHSFSYVSRSNFVGAPGAENFLPRSIDYNMSLTGLSALNGTWLQPIDPTWALSKNEGVNSCHLPMALDTEVDVSLSIQAVSTTFRYVSGILQPGFRTQDVLLTTTGRVYIGLGNVTIVIWQPGTMVVGDGSGSFFTYDWQVNNSGVLASLPVGFFGFLWRGAGGVATTSTLDLLNYHQAVCGDRIPGGVQMTQYASGGYYVARTGNVPGPLPVGASNFYLPPPEREPYMVLQPNPSVFTPTFNSGYVEVEYV
jgi:hypothetical protein